MTIEDARAAARANHDWLTQHFVRRLLDEEPASVLDVGCGAGQLVRTCLEAGVRAFGVDQSGPRLEALVDAGIDARPGTAYELPFGDASVDWVTLRHVPHHLEDPPRAFREALRVARTGVHLAEPWYDRTIDSQRGCLAVDLWEKRLDRMGGMYHADALDLDALLDALPDDVGTTHSIRAHRDLNLTERSQADYREVAERRLSRMEHGEAERPSLVALFEELESLGLSWNGSLVVTLRRA